MSERLIAVDFAERTDPGRDPTKQINEDACAYRVTPLGHLAVVCDGMGGHEGGKAASNRAIKAIFETFERGSQQAELTPRGRADLLRAAITQANSEVYSLAPPELHARPGSTVVAILVHPAGAEIAHVGDSRIYVVHGSQVIPLTRDHSVVEQLVAAGVLTPEQASKHPDANQIVRALGMKPDVEVELAEHPYSFVAGDTFILCSDGMSDLVKPEDLLQIVGSAPAAQIAGQLVDLANARGGHDNISVQVLRTRESADAPAAKPLPPTVVAQTIVDDRNSDPARITFVPPPTAAGAIGGAIASIPANPPRSAMPSSSDEDDASPRRSPAVIIGVILGLVGLGIAGVALWLATAKHEHHTAQLPLVVDAGVVPTATPTDSAPAVATTPVDIDAGIVLPPLGTSSASHRGGHRPPHSSSN
jgi:serine/threonine protein phosphatase PrpC